MSATWELYLLISTLSYTAQIICWLFLVIIFIFWLLAIINAVKRKNWKQKNDQTIWILIIALTGIIGAIIYYFTIKHQLDKEPKKGELYDK